MRSVPHGTALPYFVGQRLEIEAQEAKRGAIADDMRTARERMNAIARAKYDRDFFDLSARW